MTNYVAILDMEEVKNILDTTGTYEVIVKGIDGKSIFLALDVAASIANRLNYEARCNDSNEDIVKRYYYADTVPWPLANGFTTVDITMSTEKEER